MSKSNSLTIPWVLHFFLKKEKIQANKLLYIYTSYSVTISRIWLILYKLYYCTCRNNLFCFKLILATLDCSSICCRKKNYLHLAIVNFLLQGMFSRTTSLKKQRNHILSKTHSSADSTLSIKSTTWKDLRIDILKDFFKVAWNKSLQKGSWSKNSELCITFNAILEAIQRFYQSRKGLGKVTTPFKKHITKPLKFQYTTVKAKHIKTEIILPVIKIRNSINVLCPCKIY